MKDSLKCGFTFRFKHEVPRDGSVVHRCHAPMEPAGTPNVLATGVVAALFEWACTQAVKPYLEGEEQTVSVDMKLTHLTPTPPGMNITIAGKLERAIGPLLTFSLLATDGMESIAEATHGRLLVNARELDGRMSAKAVALHDCSMAP